MLTQFLFLENQIKTNKNTERRYYRGFIAMEKQKNEINEQLQNINWAAQLRQAFQSITVKNKLDKKIIKTEDPFKKLQLEDKVKAYKANLTKLLIRINKAKLKQHYNNYFLENKNNLLKTWDAEKLST